LSKMPGPIRTRHGHIGLSRAKGGMGLQMYAIVLDNDTADRI